MNLRILHFAGSYFPVPGGTTTRICNMLAGPENEHLLVVPYPLRSQCFGDSPVGEEIQGHIRIRRVRLGPLSRKVERIPFWGNCLRAREFVRRVGNDTFDILHGHNPRACAMASLQFKRRTGLPMVYEAHGIMQDQCNLPKALGVFEPLNRMSTWLACQAGARLERRVVEVADRLIVQTESAKTRLIQLYGLQDRPVDVIGNGVDVERFDSELWLEQRDSIRGRHNWKARVVCLYAGYLDVVNGIDFLLQALPRLSDQVKARLKIVLLGRGPLQSEVEQAAKTHHDLIDFLGLVEYDQMPAYYAASDVFIIPRLPTPQAETLLPMKLLEAMAMEKVLLVSNVAAMAAVIRDGENGLVFEKGSTEDFLCKLETLATRAGHLNNMARRARKDVLDKYTWEVSRKRLQAVYEELVQ